MDANTLPIYSRRCILICGASPQKAATFMDFQTSKAPGPPEQAPARPPAMLARPSTEFSMFRRPLTARSAPSGPERESIADSVTASMAACRALPAAAAAALFSPVEGHTQTGHTQSAVSRQGHQGGDHCEFVIWPSNV